MLPIAIFNPFDRRTVTFYNPVKGRRWLQLLTDAGKYGILFRPSLHVDASALGFSFQSNLMGLRGPCNPDGPGVILGTSFAMGLSVSNGSNWYDLALDENLWFNAAMPVGVANSIRVIDDFYRGPRDTLLYLYHPNVWKTAAAYQQLEASGLTAFQYFRWRTALGATLALYPKWLAKEIVKAATRRSIYRKWGGRTFYFNPTYNWMPATEQNIDFVDAQAAALVALFKTFRRVDVVRVPIKEDSAPTEISKNWKPLVENYDFWWNRFKGSLPGNATAHLVNHAKFGSDHFLPFDTHWSEAGNALFARHVEIILRGTV